MEPTNQPGQWLKLPAAMAPMSPRMCATRLQDRLRVSGHLEPSGQLALDFVTIKMSGGALLDQPCLDGSIWLDGLSNIRFERMVAAHPQTIFCLAEPGRSCK